MKNIIQTEKKRCTRFLLNIWATFVVLNLKKFNLKLFSYDKLEIKKNFFEDILMYDIINKNL